MIRYPDLLRAACAAHVPELQPFAVTYHWSGTPVALTWSCTSRAMVFGLSDEAMVSGIMVGDELRVLDEQQTLLGTAIQRNDKLWIQLPDGLSGGHCNWTGIRLQHFDGDRDYIGYTMRYCDTMTANLGMAGTLLAA